MTSGVPPRMKSAAAHSAQTPKDKTVSHRNIALPDFQRAMHGLGSSSATEKHKDRRTRRARTRSADRERSIRDYT